MQKSNLAKNILKTALFYILILVVWQLIWYIGVNVLKIFKSYTMASPIQVIQTLYRLASEHNTLWIAIFISMKRLFIGYIISLVAGITLAIIMISCKFFYKDIKALLLGIQTLPNVCWIPFAILWYGLSEGAILFVIVMGSSFSIAIAIDAGIKNINPIYTKAAKTMGCNKFMLNKDVVLPAALPHIITGLKQGWAFAWRALMAGEVLSASLGLGQLLVYGREVFDMGQVVGIMIVIMIIGILFDKIIFGTIEDKILQKRGLSMEVK